jgi:hypothetical protein
MSFRDLARRLSGTKKVENNNKTLSTALNFIKNEQDKAQFLESVNHKFGNSSDIFCSYLSIEQLLMLFKYDKYKLNRFLEICNLNNINLEEQIKAGNLETLKYLNTLGIKFGEYEMNIAIEFGKLDVLIWLNSIGVKLIFGDNPANSLNLALKFGHLNILKYINSEMFTSSALKIAIENGHFEIVRYLITLGLIPDKSMVDLACYKGHLEISKYLYYLGFMPSDEVLYKIVLNKDQRIFKFLLSIHMDLSDNFLQYAYNIGNVEIIKLLQNIKDQD